MSGEAYYQHQATARGLHTAEDVATATATMSAIYDRLLPGWLPPDRQAAIYEAACGPGIMLRYLKRAGYTNISGSDSSTCQIQLTQAAGLPVVEADSLRELENHPDETWDCLIAIDFIEHLPKDVLIHFFGLAWRKLKPGGCLILRGPNGDSPFVGRNLYNDITHFWAYTTVALRALLGMAGFQRVEFAEESEASIQRHRWVKVPLMRLAQLIVRSFIRAAAREYVQWLSPSIYVAAWKP